MLDDQWRHLSASPRSRHPQQQDLKRQSRVVTSPPDLAAPSPPSSTGRLLPYVPKRYVVPPGRTLSEARRWAKESRRGVSFDDDVIAVEDLDESGVDLVDGPGTSKDEEEEEEEDLLDDLPPPADLIDVIGPAPSSRPDIPEPAPSDPDLLMNMVTYREQPEDYGSSIDKATDDYNGHAYYPPVASGARRQASEFGSLRRNGHMADSEEAASRFTYGTYKRHQMSRFGRPDPMYKQSDRDRGDYDPPYYEEEGGYHPDGYSARRPPLARGESEDSYRRYRHLSDNQSALNYHDKESPSYLGLNKPLINLDSSPYQQPVEDIYQNVGPRLAREEYGPMANGYISNEYTSGYEKENISENVMLDDRRNDFQGMNEVDPSQNWNNCQDPYAVTDDGSRVQENVYMNNYTPLPKEDSTEAYTYQYQQEPDQLQLQQQQQQQQLLQQQQQQQYEQYQYKAEQPVSYPTVSEEQPFLSESNLFSDGLDWSGQGHQGFTPAPPSCSLDNNIRLSPSWEDRNVPEDQLNFHNMSVSMDRLDMEINPPRDRLNLIYLTLVLHGIGTLMPWNMIITAKELKRGDWVYMLTQYFVNFKLGKEYTNSDEPYATYFLLYVGIAAQIPNVVFNWLNVFLNIGGTLTTRMVWTLLVEVMVFVLTIILAMVDTSQWPGTFFYLTVGCVAVLNMANGIYQNTVYGFAAKLPFKYIGAVVLGSNLSGTIVALINIITVWVSPNPRTAAIYYFITALFILLACFDTYFALPLNRFYRYHNHLHTKMLQEKKNEVVLYKMPYWTIFKQCSPQCFNVFFTYFVTLTVFPAVYSDVKKAHDDFFIADKYFSPVTCFFTFNVCSVIGNMLSSACTLPGPRWLFVPVMLRFLFVPFFLLCNYRPNGVERLWPTLVHWDQAYWAGGALFGVTGGFLASLSMMYCPRCVEPEYSTIAGMFGAASIVTGMIAGIGFSYLMPLMVSTEGLSFEFPDWWPPYVAR